MKRVLIALYELIVKHKPKPDEAKAKKPTKKPGQ
jgi:hypothetical protein